MTFRIRPAVPGDEIAIFGLICALAEYEKLSHEVVGSAAALAKHLFDRPAACSALVAEFKGDKRDKRKDGSAGIEGRPQTVVGFALYFPTYSTFLTAPGVHLEDLFVLPDFRTYGIGKALLREVAQIAVESGAGRLEWAVLDWNQPAIDFYLGLGSAALEDWTIHRVTGDALKKLADSTGRE